MISVVESAPMRLSPLSSPSWPLWRSSDAPPNKTQITHPSRSTNREEGSARTCDGGVGVVLGRRSPLTNQSEFLFIKVVLLARLRNSSRVSRSSDWRSRRSGAGWQEPVAFPCAIFVTVLAGRDGDVVRKRIRPRTHSALAHKRDLLRLVKLQMCVKLPSSGPGEGRNRLARSSASLQLRAYGYGLNFRSAEIAAWRNGRRKELEYPLSREVCAARLPPLTLFYVLLSCDQVESQSLLI